MSSPSITAYHALLPEAEASYPDVVIKASVLRSVLDRVPDGPLEPVGLPAIDRILREPPGVNEWLPEVMHNTVLCAVFDQRFAANGGQTAFESWSYTRNRQLFATPLYRILFMVASPQRLLVGLTSRWSAFRRGSKLDLEVNEPGRALLRISHRPHLLPQVVLLALRQAIRAAIDAGGGAVISAVVTAVSPSDTTIEVRYRKRTEEA